MRNVIIGYFFQEESLHAILYKTLELLIQITLHTVIFIPRIINNQSFLVSLGGGVTKMNFDIIFKVNGMCSQTAGDVIPLDSCL